MPHYSIIKTETGYRTRMDIADIISGLCKKEDRMYKLNDGRVVPLEVMQDSARGVALYIAGIAESMLTIKQQDIKNVIDRELGC